MKQIYLFCLALLAAAFAFDASALTLAPPSGTSMKYIDAIDFSYDSMVDNVDLQKVYLTDETTGERTYCSGFAALTTDYTRYMMGGTLSFPKVSAPGQYTFTMEAGAVKPWVSSDPTNELVTATYTVDPEAPELTVFSSYTLSPATATPLAKLSRIQISFPKIGYYDTVVIDSEKAAGITLTCGDKTYYGVNLYGSYGTYSFYIGETPDASETVDVTEPGTYTLTIPAGTFTNGAEDPDDLKGNNEITVAYEVSDNIDFAYTCDPASGSEISIAKLYSIAPRISFGSEVTSISLTPAIEGAAFSVTRNGEPLEAVDNVNTQEGYSIEAYSSSLTIRLSISLVTEPSEFRISAPRGAFTIDGLPSPVIDYVVTYLPPKEFTYEITPNPDATIASLSTVTVFFTNADKIEKAYYTRNTAATLTSVRPGSSAIRSSAVDVAAPGADSAYPTLKITFDSNIANDNYVFSFPKGEVLVDGEDSPKIECLFRVDSNTGLSEVASENMTATTPGHGVIRVLNPAGAAISIYTVDGRLVCSFADADTMIGVPAGCYIVNGAGRSIKVTVE